MKKKYSNFLSYLAFVAIFLVILTLDSSFKESFLFSPRAMAEENTIEETLKKVKNKVAPDQRITLFDISVVPNNEFIELKGKVLDSEQKMELLKAFSEIGKVKDEIVVFPFPEFGDYSFGIANLPVLNVRENPGHPSQLITQGLLNRGMKILEKKKDWLKVALDTDDYIGWVKESDVWLVDKKNYENWSDYNKIVITDKIVNLLNTADERDGSGINVYLSTILNVSEDLENYYKVILPKGNKHYSGKYFYISKKNAKFLGKKIIPDKDILLNLPKKADDLLSTPYLWGGTSPLQTDCSGFTQMLYKINGYLLPRDADQQQKATKPVEEIEDLILGDLVFFPGHVGLYIGKNIFIHSSVGYGGVAYTSFSKQHPLYNEWYLNNFKGGGRVIN